MNTADPLVIRGGNVTLADLREVLAHDAARPPRPLQVAGEAREKVAACRRFIEQVVLRNEPIYGITTGFGKLANVRIPADQLETLQRLLILSHAAGVGDLLPPVVSRAMLLLRINSLACGHSGITLDLLDHLVTLYNRGVCPCVPARGSVGASGDLAPLAHLSLVLLGEGEAHVDGQRISGAAALKAAGLAPIVLKAKEGLALINGTQLMTAQGCRILHDALDLLTVADIVGAMTVEAMKGSIMPFSPQVHALRPHPGQVAVAQNMTALIGESEIVLSHRFCDKVQDPYSLRCMPQVHGAARDSLNHVREVIERELAAVTDNPLVFPTTEGGQVISAGNFHGEPVAMVLDYAGIALTIMAGISERRVEQLVNPALSGLPAFLSPRPGLNSGYMITQVTAAALVSECKALAHPAVVDSIPTSANQEDYVSMGPIAAEKTLRILDNAANVLAIEALAAAQGLSFETQHKPGPGVAAALACIRTVVPRLEDDRVPAPDVAAVRKLIDSRELLNAVRAVCPDLV
ncbi:MAG: histidine ammonia-lyase [Planctomycetota bacterium]